jgi:hypothetical protein
VNIIHGMEYYDHNMLVKESISFQRGQDPKDSLGIGDPKERKILSNFSYIEPIIKNLELPDDEFSFKDFRRKIESLKEIVEYIILRHVREKYGVEAKFETEISYSQASNLFAVANVGEYRYEFRRNGVRNAYWIKVVSLKGKQIGKIGAGYSVNYVETSQSSSLRIFDQKFNQLYKKFH